jgi:hypothetical protein
MKEAAHLIRLAAVLAGGLLLFAVLRVEFVPPSFGQYGHYRGNALAEIRNRPIEYAGREVCTGCHQEVAELLHKSAHASIGCETCHGPRAAHTEDPSFTKGALPDTGKICAQCHESDAARPSSFRQVNTKEHSGGSACNTCHTAHKPKVGG